MKKLYFFLAVLFFACGASAQVVINEVYGGGGNSGATLKNDFIELYNNGNTAVDLTGWSVQYNSSTGTAWTAANITNLSGIIPGHGYFLIQEAAGAGGTTNLPTPDLTGTIAMAAGAGKVILCSVITPQTGANPTGPQIVDKVGYGTGTNGFEGDPLASPPGGPTATISATISAQRTPTGKDTDVNNTDFTTGTPTPANSGTGFGTTVTMAAGADGAEPATNGNFTVTLSSAAPAGGVTINYTLAGTATPTADYTDPQNGTITIPQGQSAALITINTTDDSQYELAETISINISSVTAPFTIATGTATINLFSDDVNPVSLTGAGYLQNFDSWVSTGSATVYSLLPVGWTFLETGTGANTSYTATTGAANAGDTYSFGSAADRAFGSIQSGSVVPQIGAAFTNNTGAVITSMRIAYRGEQWRFGAQNRADQLDFQYSTDASSLANGTWNDVNQLDFVSPNITAAVGSLDGNATGNFTNISYTITGLSIPVGSGFYIRWNDANADGADDGLAIDGFNLQTNPADLDAPTASLFYPANTSTGAPISFAANIVFNENVQKNPGNIVIKKLSDNTVAASININNVTVSGNTAYFPVSGLTPGTGYYVEIAAGTFTDLANNSYAGISGNSTWSFTTGTQLAAANFNTCGTSLSDGFTQYSVTGAIVWACTSFGRDATNLPSGSAPNGVQINGYDNTLQSNTPNEDWFISPSFNLTGSSYPLLSFWSRTRFNGLPLQLKVSTNYTSGDPSTATWTNLNGRFPEQTSDAWTLSSNINLEAFKQSNVHVAFVYYSSNDEGARWTLDDISIDNSATPPPPALIASTYDMQYAFTAAGASSVKTFTVTSSDLTGDITFTATAPFTVSADGVTYGTTTTLLKTAVNNSTTPVYVKFAPAENDKNYTGTVTIHTTNATDSLVNIKGTSIDPAKTLEVVNWNMEWFHTADPTLGPKDKDLQKANAKTILSSIGADLYALVEVVDTAALGDIVRTSMPGYKYIICNYGSHGNPFEAGASPMSQLQKEAFVYRASVFTNIDTTSLLSAGVNTAADLSNPAYNYWSSGRYPFMMTADVTLGGIVKRMRFIALHAKANTSPTITSYNRRKAGADSLHTYLNSNYPNDNIVILGDFNDDLDSTITDGITPKLSSYKLFTDDAASFYSPTLAGLSLTGKKSTVSYNDVIDHVVVSNEVKQFFMNSSAAVLTDVTSLVANYGSTTSDHYPVFTRYAFDAALLPVRLVSFAAARDGNVVKLNWKSAEESNSSEYIVQRSADGANYSNIGTITARGVASDYALTDANPVAGDNFYRLKPVDKDGKFVYSTVVKVNFTMLPGIRISPNPANSFIYVSLENMNTSTTLQVIDMNGKLVRQQLIAQGTANKWISLVGMVKGIYTVKLVSANKVVTQKLVIQ